jgi:hypothetical protein
MVHGLVPVLIGLLRSLLLIFTLILILKVEPD